MKNTVKVLISLTLCIILCTALFACKKNDKKDATTPTEPLVVAGWTVAYQYDLSPYIEIEKNDYMGIAYPILSAEVTEEDVQAELDALSDKYPIYTEITDRGAENGDWVTLDYKGFLDGVEIENSAAVGDQFPLGEASFIPGFQEGIVGHTVGETFTVDAHFPDDYRATELAGKTAQFEMTLHKIEEVSYPEVNDEFIFQNTDYNTIDEYKEYLKQTLTAEKLENNLTQQRNEAYSKVYSNVTIKDWPREEVDKYFNEFVEMYEKAAVEYGMSFEELISQLGSTPEEFAGYAEQYAQSAVETDMVFFAIAKNENLIASLTQGDFDEYVKKMAEEYEVSVEEFLANNKTENIWRGLVGETAMDYIILNGVAK